MGIPIHDSDACGGGDAGTKGDRECSATGSGNVCFWFKKSA